MRAVFSQPNFFAWSSAPIDNKILLCGSAINLEITEAQAFGSWPSTKIPEIPSDTAVRSPPTALAMTGVPQACASSATSPKLSEYEGTQTKSDARYQSASSLLDTGSLK